MGNRGSPAYFTLNKYCSTSNALLAKSMKALHQIQKIVNDSKKQPGEDGDVEVAKVAKSTMDQSLCSISLINTRRIRYHNFI